MTVIVGGLRARLIRESLFNTIHDALAGLGWFDAGRQHEPITFLSAPVDDREEIRFNTIAIADADISSLDWEIGSVFSEHSWTLYVDIYAESNALGMQLAHDIKDILQGRLPSVGRNEPSFNVYDYRDATPSMFTTCQIDNVMVDRAQGFAEPWRRWWYSVGVTVLDYYGTEDDG
jgi:hypothetical protein